MSVGYLIESEGQRLSSEFGAVESVWTVFDHDDVPAAVNQYHDGHSRR